VPVIKTCKQLKRFFKLLIMHYLVITNLLCVCSCFKISESLISQW